MTDELDVDQDLNKLLLKLLEIDNNLQISYLVTLIEVINEEGLAGSEYVKRTGFNKARTSRHILYWEEKRVLMRVRGEDQRSLLCYLTQQGKRLISDAPDKHLLYKERGTDNGN